MSLLSLLSRGRAQVLGKYIYINHLYINILNVLVCALLVQLLSNVFGFLARMIATPHLLYGYRRGLSHVLYQPIRAVEIVVLQLLLLLLLCPLCSHFPDGFKLLDIYLLAIIIGTKAAPISCTAVALHRLVVLLLQFVLRCLSRTACGALHTSQLWTTHTWQIQLVVYK